MTQRYLTTAECAAYLGRTPAAVKMLVHRGQIPHSKTGRRLSFDRDKIDRWMERHARRTA